MENVNDRNVSHVWNSRFYFDVFKNYLKTTSIVTKNTSKVAVLSRWKTAFNEWMNVFIWCIPDFQKDLKSPRIYVWWCNSSNCKRSQAKSIFFPDVVYQHKKYPIRPISGSGLLLVSSEMSCVRPIPIMSVRHKVCEKLSLLFQRNHNHHNDGYNHHNNSGRYRD